MHMAQLMPLTLTVFCFSKIQLGFTFLVPDKWPLNGCVFVIHGNHTHGQCEIRPVTSLAAQKCHRPWSVQWLVTPLHTKMAYTLEWSPISVPVGLNTKLLFICPTPLHTVAKHPHQWTTGHNTMQQRAADICNGDCKAETDWLE